MGVLVKILLFFCEVRKIVSLTHMSGGIKYSYIPLHSALWQSSCMHNQIASYGNRNNYDIKRHDSYHQLIPEISATCKLMQEWNKLRN